TTSSSARDCGREGCSTAGRESRTPGIPSRNTAAARSSLVTPVVVFYGLSRDGLTRNRLALVVWAVVVLVGFRCAGRGSSEVCVVDRLIINGLPGEGVAGDRLTPCGRQLRQRGLIEQRGLIIPGAFATRIGEDHRR